MSNIFDKIYSIIFIYSTLKYQIQFFLLFCFYDNDYLNKHMYQSIPYNRGFLKFFNNEVNKKTQRLVKSITNETAEDLLKYSILPSKFFRTREYGIVRDVYKKTTAEMVIIELSK